MNSSDRQREKMFNTPIPRLITSLALPAIIVQLITIVYNTADTYFISQINKSASAAVGAVFAIMSIINAMGFGFGMGASSICSIKLGQRKDDEANKVISSALVGSIIIGSILMILGLIFLNPLMKLIGCSDTMLEYAKQYTIFILIAAPISSSCSVMSCCLRAEGKNNLAMIGAVTGGLINMVLDPLFIFYFKMGVVGAALATAISQVINFSICLRQYILNKTACKISLSLVSKDISTYIEIMSVGFPTVCRQGIASLATILLNKQAVVYGDAAVAAISIANKVYMLVRSLVLGLGQGFQPVAGYNYGAKNYERTKMAFKFTTAVGSVVCILVALFTFFFKDQIMWWFIQDTEVLVYGRQTLLFLSLSTPFLAFSTLSNQLYQCLGFKKEATILASCRQGIFFVPIVLIAPIFLDVVGVEITQSLADILTALVSIPFIIKMFNKLLVDDQKMSSTM